MKGKVMKILNSVLVLLFYISLASPVNAMMNDVGNNPNNYFVSKNDLDTLKEAKLFFTENPTLFNYDSYSLNTSLNQIGSIQPFVVINPGIDVCYGSTSNFTLEYCVSQHYLVIDVTYSNSFSSCYNPLLNNALACSSYAYIQAGLKFAQNVKGGSVWDYKQLYASELTQVKTTINGKVYYLSAQDIGNIHYGYVGSSVFSPTVLKAAAGIYNAIQNGVKISWFTYYFDDPTDQAAIQRGIDWESNGTFY